MKIIFQYLFLLTACSFCCLAQDTLLNFSEVPKKMYFCEDFEDNRNRMEKFENSMAKGYTELGKFIFENKKTDGFYQVWNNYSLDPKKNYYIELEFSKIKGTYAYGNGLIFNHSASKKENKYVFIITDAKYYIIFKLVDGVYEETNGWTPCDFIHLAGNNKLGVFAKGNEMLFYINNHLISISDRPTHLGSNIGYFASHSTQLAIDKFLIHYDTLPIDVIKDAVQGYKKTRLDQSINSDLDESFPVLNADGTLMFFSRSVNIGHFGSDKRTIMYSEYDSKAKKWTNAVALPEIFNQVGKPQAVYISPDKNMLIVNATYDKEGVILSDEGLAVSYRTKEGWSIPQNITIEDWENLNEYESYSFSSTNKTMILSLQTKDGFGENDLFVSFNKGDNSWSKPRNLGAVVNSFGDEFSPCLAPDNVTLYYSSVGKPGYGKADIFVTRRLDDTWLNWSKPQNLGKEINSKDNNSGLTVDAKGQYAYIHDFDTLISKGEISKIQIPTSARPKPVVIIKGKVVNKLTNSPLSTSIKYINIDSGVEVGIAKSSPEDGSFILILPYGVNYSLIASEKGYMSESKNIDLKAMQKKEFNELTEALYLTPIQVGSSIILNSIFFNPNKSDLLKTSFPELTRLYSLLIENDSLIIQVEGHSATRLKDAKEEDLITISLDRANSVKDYLIKIGINEARIKTIGYGKSRPVSQNNVLNRRVEIKIIKN